MTGSEETGPLQVERLCDGRRKLTRQFKYTVGSEPFCVPAGFVTNYSSLPWGTRWFIHWTRVDIAGVLHDYLYSDKKREYSRLRADWVWLRVALSGCRRAFPHQAVLGLIALLLFGWMLKATGSGCSFSVKVITGLLEVPVAVLFIWWILDDWRCMELLLGLWEWLSCCP